MPVQVRTDDDLLDRAMLTPADLSVVTSGAVGRQVRRPVACAAPIAYNWGSPATAGLWRVDARDGAGGGQLVYSYFVKLLRHVRLWPGLAMLPTDALREEMVRDVPWRFELDMYESGIGSLLPAGLRTPVLHHVKHADNGHIGLWWEFITQRPGPWRLEDYRRAAYLLGRLAARRREGVRPTIRFPRWRATQAQAPPCRPTPSPGSCAA
jgi:hypothetical protein